MSSDEFDGGLSDVSDENSEEEEQSDGLNGDSQDALELSDLSLHDSDKDEDDAEEDDVEYYDDESDENQDADADTAPNGDQDEESDDNAIVLLNQNKEKDSAKSISVQRQLKICDQLLYVKIRMHAALRAFNELPRGKEAVELLKTADEATKANYSKARTNAQRLLTVLQQAEKLLLKGSTQTMSIPEGKLSAGNDSDDEEIESSEDEKDEDNADNNDDEANGDDNEGIPDYTAIDEPDDDEDASSAAFRGWKESEKSLAQAYSRFDAFRRATIEKWDERTKLSTVQLKKTKNGDFSSFSDATLNQIDKILRDKARLIRRTRTKRGDIERIGGNPNANEDPEVFDDNDFYHAILKEILEKKNEQELDPSDMTREWLRLQKLRDQRSKKNIVDRRASKGRKIRYKSIPKLLNFHAAQPESVPWSHERRDLLFKSLFIC